MPPRPSRARAAAPARRARRRPGRSRRAAAAPAGRSSTEPVPARVLDAARLRLRFGRRVVALEAQVGVDLAGPDAVARLAGERLTGGLVVLAHVSSSFGRHPSARHVAGAAVKVRWTGR